MIIIKHQEIDALVVVIVVVFVVVVVDGDVDDDDSDINNTKHSRLESNV